MHLNDFLFVSPTIFNEGWEERDGSVPLPPQLKAVCGELKAFYNTSKKIGVNISLEDKQPNVPPYIHLSIRQDGMQTVDDEEALSILNMFFPGAVIAKSKEEFMAGGLWAERRGVGLMPKVRHFSRLVKESK